MPGIHLIEDLCFEVEFQAEAQAFDGQLRLAAFAQGPALRIIDELFDEALGDGEVLRLERLELDLGPVAQDEMEDQWSRRLRERLRHALDEQRAALEWGMPAPFGSGATRRTRRQARREALLFFLRHGRLPWHAARGKDAGALARWARELLRDSGGELAAALRSMGDRAALARRLVRQFPLDWLQSLMHELLPQGSGRAVPVLLAPRTQHEEDLLVASVCDALADNGSELRDRLAQASRRQPHLALLRVRLAAALAGSSSEGVEAAWQVLLVEDRAGLRRTLREAFEAPSVRRRMAQQFSEAMWVECASLWLPPAEAKELAAVVKAVSQASRPAAMPTDARPVVAEGEAWSVALAALLCQRGMRVDTGTCVRELVQHVAAQETRHDVPPPPTGARAHPLRRAVADVQAAVQRLLDRLLPDQLRRVLRWLGPPAGAAPNLPDTAARAPVATAAPSSAPSLPAPASIASDASADESADAIFIANAGLVLAGPYLSHLLSMLGLTDGRVFKDDAAAERAVLLLQFVATGALDSPEPLLVLNKLMCGMDIAQPVAREFEPTERERHAVDGMLKAMIEHWKTLGRTSVAGLRESFLQREGRLERQEDAWQLKVEPRSFDMLIDQLPWGYATLRFPWMKGVVHVDWR